MDSNTIRPGDVISVARKIFGMRGERFMDYAAERIASRRWKAAA